MNGRQKYRVVLQNNSLEATVKVSVITRVSEHKEIVKEIALPPADFPDSTRTLELDNDVILEAYSYVPGLGTTKIPGIYCITRDEIIHFHGEESRAMCDVVLQNNTDQEIVVENDLNFDKIAIAPWDAEGVCLPLGAKIYVNSPEGSPVQPESYLIEDHGVIFYTSNFPRLAYPEVVNLHRWFEPGTHFELIYQGSKDGFEGANFRAKAHGQGPVLVVVTTSEGYIFGGFASEGFSNVKEGSSSNSNSTTFTFSLRNHLDSEPAQFFATNSNNKNAFVQGSYKHVSFGDTEMCMNEDGLGGIFSKRAGTNMLSSPDPTYFTGKTAFFTQDIEVYQVVESG